MVAIQANHRSGQRRKSNGALWQGRNNVDNEQVEARIKKVFIQELGLFDEQYTLDAIISDDIGADSLDRVELIMGMEEEFDIT